MAKVELSPLYSFKVILDEDFDNIRNLMNEKNMTVDNNDEVIGANFLFVMRNWHFVITFSSGKLLYIKV